MNRVTGQTFEHEHITIDGTIFEDCRFVECELEFGAHETVGFDGCTFVSCEWIFEGPALLAYQFLAALYDDGLGMGSQALLDAVFAAVREGPTDDARLSTRAASAA